jgi:hypothetical protein
MERVVEKSRRKGGELAESAAEGRAISHQTWRSRHSFLPENLRGQRATYRGKDIFSIEGFRAFRKDREPVVDHLFRRAFGLR